MDIPTAPPAVEAVPAAVPGLRSSVRLLLEHLGDHLDLLRLELGQEASRLGAVVGYWFALALFAQLALTMALTVLVASYWNTEYRTHTLLMSAAALLAGLGYCVLQLKRLGERASARFSASGQQLRRDLDLMRELI